MTAESRSRTVLITGASRGLGEALAQNYAAPGTRLVLIGRNGERLERVASACRSLGAETVIGVIDVMDTERLARYVAETDSRWPIDIVFANAGIEASLGADLSAEPIDTVLAQFRTNIDGVAATVTPVLDPMRARRRGTIVLISSLAAFAPLPDQPAYCASKAAVLAWGEALAPWLAAAGVRLVIVCPGFIKTGMSEHYRGWRPLEWSAERAARRIGRMIEAQQTRIVFPLPLYWLAIAGRSVPRRLREWVIGRFFRLSVDRPS